MLLEHDLLNGIDTNATWPRSSWREEEGGPARSPRRAASALRLRSDSRRHRWPAAPRPSAPALRGRGRQRRSARRQTAPEGCCEGSAARWGLRAVIKATAGAISHQRGFRVRVVAELVANPREEHAWFPLLSRAGTFAPEPRSLQRAAEQPSRDLRSAEPSSTRNSSGEAQPPPFSELEEESLLWFFGNASLCLCWFVQKPSHRQSVSAELRK